MKLCKSCGSEIGTDKRSDAIYCSDACGNRIRGLRWEHANPDKVIARREADNAKTADRMYYRIKSRAKRDGIPFTLLKSDIVVPEICPVLGIPLNHRNRGSGFHDDSPSLDKIRPELGYVQGNVRVISARANLLKSNATSDEIRLILTDLERLGM